MGIRVKAFFNLPGEFGFYGTLRRRDGDIFEIETEDHFSERWMKRLNKPGRKPKDENPDS